MPASEKSKEFATAQCKCGCGAINDGFRYVGDGSLFIGGKSPDYIHDSKRLIIELFGDYWHNPSEVEPRLKHFSKFGYKGLIIWEHELNDLNIIVPKINSFVGGDQCGR